MKQTGIIDGFQWIDGSFFEDCESIQNRPPRDMDVVTFGHRPNGFTSSQDWLAFMNANLHLFSRSIAKGKYKCDAFFVDLSLPAETLVSRARYWFGLFSHQRITYVWKGLVQVSLSEDEAGAMHLINGGSNAP